MEHPSAKPVAGMPTRGHFAFGHNHRMSELQAAVALAQLSKIALFSATRQRLAEVLAEEIEGCPGLLLAYRYPETAPNHWVYAVRIDPDRTALTAPDVARLCEQEEGVSIDYYSEINYLESIFQEAKRRRQTPFGYPLPEHVHYAPGLCPNAEAVALRILPFGTHHAEDPEPMRLRARALRRTMERHVKT
ncbi:MAG: DegT/DnrJ/EryC1/StrS family aminotransferase [Armatimonadetes bacterium]|nr:DegT/DnrJ/EryC1/StrS family aminotransferase [Armatimonadota bacterium]